MNVSTRSGGGAVYRSSQTVTVVGFSRRLLALAIDGILLAFLTFILATAIGFIGMMVASFNVNSTYAFDRWIIWAGLVLSVVYYVGFWTGSGQTVGKTLTGIKVVNVTGGQLSFGQALLRYIGYIVSSAVFSLGFIWVLFDQKRQGWHDKMAGSYVVESDEEVFDAATAQLVPSDSHPSKIWFVIWIVLALIGPAGFFGGLWFLGPIMSRLIRNILGTS